QCGAPRFRSRARLRTPDRMLPRARENAPRDSLLQRPDRPRAAAGARTQSSWDGSVRPPAAPERAPSEALDGVARLIPGAYEDGGIATLLTITTASGRARHHESKGSSAAPTWPAHRTRRAMRRSL